MKIRTEVVEVHEDEFALDTQGTRSVGNMADEFIQAMIRDNKAPRLFQVTFGDEDVEVLKGKAKIKSRRD